MDKRTIIAFVIIGIVFLFYDDYLRWIYPQPPESETDSTAVAEEEVYTKRAPRTRSEDQYIGSPSEDSLETFAVEETSFEPIKTETLPERIIIVETERIRAKLSSNGARLVSYQLKPNGRYLKMDEEMLPNTDAARPGFRFWTYDGPQETNRMQFRLAGDESEGDKVYRVNKGEIRRVEFVTDLSQERSLSVVYKFNGDGYVFNCRVKGVGLENTWVRDYAEIYWSGGLGADETPSMVVRKSAIPGMSDSNYSMATAIPTGAGMSDTYYSKAYVYFSGDVLEHQKINKKKTIVNGPLSGETRWCAVRTKYFMAALIPETRNAIGAWMESIFDSTYTGNDHPNRLGAGLRVPLERGLPATPIRVYLGPIDYDILGRIDPSLRKTMNWGWKIIAPFSKAILWSLKKLGHLIPNYGLCIIIFSILIKVIVWPLTRKSYQSMAAMQKLQPKIKAMREKYKNEPQRVQKEMMKLYKEEKVNPMGGCLPMLLQMPLLYGLFIVFRSTIEFRSAPFVLWINDLSQPDIIFNLPFSLPLYGAHVALLPILMGISTFYQSKSTMTDPNQKMMLYFMPIFMTLIFNQFPSGLTLYYTLFNILTLVQQKITPPPKPVEMTTGKT